MAVFELDNVGAWNDIVGYLPAIVEEVGPQHLASEGRGQNLPSLDHAPTRGVSRARSPMEKAESFIVAYLLGRGCD